MRKKFDWILLLFLPFILISLLMHSYYVEAEENSIPYVYDKMGNLLFDGERHFVWNSRGELVEASKEGLEIKYFYDHNGDLYLKEVFKEDSSLPVSTQYISREYRVLPGDKIEKEFVAGGSRFVIEKNGVNEKIKTHHLDYLGSTVVSTNEMGKSLGIKRHFPFGESRHLESLNLNDQGEVSYAEKEPTRQFTGQIYDGDIGLYYYNARWYDPVSGKFLSVDPVARYEPEKLLYDPQQLNAYAYSRNNPVNYNDPTGKIPNKAQAVGLYAFISELEDQELLNFSMRQSVNSVFQYYESFDESRLKSRYLYTTNSGWLDMKHFSAATKYGISFGDTVTRFLGYFVELDQLMDINSSAFSYEDLPSNDAGLRFMKLLKEEEYLSGLAKFSGKEYEVNYKDLIIQFLKGEGVIFPEGAPNYEFIPESQERQVSGKPNTSSEPNN